MSVASVSRTGVQAAAERTRGSTLARLPARCAALVGILVVLAYPIRFFAGLADVPFWIRACWPVATVAALAFPRLSVLAFLAVSPLLPIVRVREVWPLDSLAEFWLLALLVGAWARIALWDDGPRAGFPIPAALLLVIGAASVAVTLYPFHLASDGFGPLARAVHEYVLTDLFTPVAQGHPYATMLAWVLIAEGLALLWIVLRTAGSGAAQRSSLAVAMTVGCLLVSLQGIRQWWTKEGLLPFWVAQDPDIVRINATFTDVNALGAYLATMVWIVLASAHAHVSREWRWTCRAGAAASVAALVFTASRAAWLSAALGAGLYGVGLWRFGLLPPGAWYARRFGRLLAAAAIVALIALGSLTAYATTRDIRHRDQTSYVGTVLYSLNLRTPLDERLKGRMALWEAGWRMVQARPVFGIGVGRYYNQLWAYSPHQEALIAPRENAHNYFLQVAAELGLSGASALVALFVLALVAAWRGGTGPEGINARRLALAAGVGVAVFSLTSLTGHPLLEREGQFAFWPLVGLALLSGRGARVRPTSSWRTTTAWISAAIVLLTVPPRAVREAGRVDLSRLPFGLHDPEVDRDGRVYRWTTRRAVLHVPADARALVLPLRSIAPFPQMVRVVLDNATADEVRLTDHAWHTLRYVLPARRGARYYRVELHVAPTWTPPHDPRVLGVILGAYEWSPSNRGS